MKFYRLIMHAFVASAVLVGAPAMATANAAVGHPASAPATEEPEGLTWYKWGGYGTRRECNVEGDHLVIAHDVQTFKCVEMNGGEYDYFELYVLPGTAPGA